jgi:hypothetical protein
MAVQDKIAAGVSPDAPLPSLPDGAPGRNAFKYRPRFGLILETADEPSQIALFETLKEAGFQPRVVTV